MNWIIFSNAKDGMIATAIARNCSCISDTSTFPMVDGRWSMVDGRWSMVDGRWSMVDGRWSMVDGRWSGFWNGKNNPVHRPNPINAIQHFQGFGHTIKQSYADTSEE
ncbi:hypothetical protein M3P05_18440 [Sansalvadorimonas sp. 2012CJ34-2]|uniref:Uncharacterized protein n=1 Tax=Parendozoicomonas callyspongiae TaxID=2942213 RepID=A0ABT0PLP2_9GAMM|nr:hypothetical protein [Sansalvadorimonas sp. 2012CJ34-2]MCL6271901.1 hypothetical protein [Sansalvadorimonas sp. 2012CJ34-2]